MKHALRTALVAGFLTASWAAMAQVAEAGTLTLERDRDLYQGANGGGEFKVATYTGGTVPAMGAGVNVFGGVFQTFCLERDEHLDFKGATLDWVLNTEAVAGGVGGPSPDPIDGYTAWLFDNFWNGTLTGYDYTPGAGRTDSATALQLAIWYFEEELGAGLDQQGNTVFDITATFNGNQLAKDFRDAALAAVSDPTDIGRVRVLNLTRDDQHGLLHQDILVVTAVPLPSAALLGLGLMSGVGAFELIRRRRRTFA
jgi:hypothetical protein